jgi:chloramphenicol 3-O phosphotransferase
MAGCRLGNMPGAIILINGASSAGKSTLCNALQARLPEPFWHFSIDHLRDSGMLPGARIRSGEFAWKDLRPAFFEGFYRCLPALAGAGNNLLVEHIYENPEQVARLRKAIAPFDVFLVGIHCPPEELERRELARGDRPLGDALRDYETCHTFGGYHIEVDAMEPVEANAERIVQAWRNR